MPESRTRAKKKSNYVPPPTKAGPKASPKWWAPTMIALMVAGLAYIVWAYILSNGGPIRELGQWNLGVGFAAILAGFIMTMRWR